VAPLLGLFGRREPPRGACGAARHHRPSSVPGDGRAVRAAAFLPRVARQL